MVLSEASGVVSAGAAPNGEAGQVSLGIRRSFVGALDKPEFNTVEFINHAFPNESSLVALDPLINKLRNKIRQVDADILAAVRLQSSSGSKAKEDLSAAMGAIKELSLKMREIKGKAEQSEVMVHEICRDIRKLDHAKKHITTTITALNRLAMLVLAVDRLQALTANRQYRDAAGQLEAVTQLCGHFESYSDIPKISELRDRFQAVKQTLRSHVFSDFSSLSSTVASSAGSHGSGGGSALAPGGKDSGAQMQQLADACLVVDALGPVARDELIRSVCSRELAAYQQIFQGTEVARLEKAERRYSWIKRQLKVNEDMWRIFPPKWRVPSLLCIQFCKITRTQLTEILDNSTEKPDVGTLLQALQSTLEFEEELAERFGGGVARLNGDDVQEGAKDVGRGGTQQLQPQALRAKTLQADRDAQDAQESHGAHDPNITAAHQMTFLGSISSCFEPHLSVYVELEERTLMELLDKLVMEEAWEAEEGSDTHILSSSAQMFLHIRRSFNRCCQLTRSQTLFSLHKVFQRVVRAYADRLNGRLPRAGQGLVAAATGAEWQLKVSEKDERVICSIVNTAEYCHETVAQLAESIQSRIEKQYVDSVDMSEEQDEFSGVITRALSVLVLAFETRLDAELAGMARISWATVESVGDQSDYVTQISTLLSSSIPPVALLLSPVYFQFFIEKLAACFAPRFYASIFKCKRISGTGAQQMLLDTHAVKTLLLEVPSLGGQAVPATYGKYVGRELGKAEALLKVILSPVEAIADTYRALLPEGSATDFQRILDLKGLKRTEQQPLVDELSRKGPIGAGILPLPSPSMANSLPPAPLMVASPNSSAAISAASAPVAGGGSSMLATAASREAMIARAAALGRGAMAQSAAAAAAVSGTGALKRIFQLAESAKEGASKKDITFRKLFNG